MNILLQAMCKAGLNRGEIRDALTGVEQYKGVTGAMVFDPNCKNYVPLYLAAVHDGKISHRRYPTQKEYARAGEDGVAYNGPAIADAPQGRLRIRVVGPDAGSAVERLAPLVAAHGGRYELAPVASDVPWGRASNELVKLLYQDATIGLVCTDRNSAHLAEQLAVKAFLPVIALSSDRSLTALNIPWIFRLPAGTALADAVRTMLDAAEKSGPNRGRLRDVLASGTTLAGGVRFNSTGEVRT